MKFAKNTIYTTAKETTQIYSSKEYQELIRDDPKHILRYESPQFVWLGTGDSTEKRIVVRSELASSTLDSKSPFTLSPEKQRLRARIVYEEGDEALLALARKGLVHGDIKPANFLNVNGTIKLGDLDGLTKQGTSSVTFSAYYAAPERLVYSNALAAFPTEDAFAQAQVVSHQLFPIPLLGQYIKDLHGDGRLQNILFYMRRVDQLRSSPKEQNDFRQYVEKQLDSLALTTETEQNMKRFLKAAYEINPIMRAEHLKKEFPETFGKAYEQSGFNTILSLLKSGGGIKTAVAKTEPATEQILNNVNIASEKTKIILPNPSNCILTLIRVADFL